jgi:AcrR family transcriptional regulator
MVAEGDRELDRAAVAPLGRTMTDAMDDPVRDGTFAPWQRIERPLDARRYELFELAAPVFRRHGYRGATIKALAHACRLKPASLYHYFSSKAEFATFPLAGRRLTWARTFVDPQLEPLVQLDRLVDLAVDRLPTYLLAMHLADEIDAGLGGRRRTTAFREGEAVFGRLIHAAAPGMDRVEVLDVARHVLSLLVGASVIGLDPAPTSSVRGRMLDALRAHLVPRHVDARRWAEVMEPTGRLPNR